MWQSPGPGDLAPSQDLVVPSRLCVRGRSLSVRDPGQKASPALELWGYRSGRLIIEQRHSPEKQGTLNQGRHLVG